MSISSLEAELSRQRRINSQLRSELSVIETGVSNAYSRLERFNSRICSMLEDGHRKLEDSKGMLSASIEVQADIQRRYLLFKNMEMANKRIRECNNKKYYEFANYRKVRKLVQGLMDNLDVHMVSDGVIYKSVERQHLQTPDYWLTCALLSIMAWKNDDKELADRAMSIALDLDKKSCSIFYMLFNLRMGREDAALKWFAQYQQCDLKGSDQRTFLLLFAMISKYINSGENVGSAVKEQIARFIRRVIDQTIQSSGYSREEMVDRIAGHLAKIPADGELKYPLLKKYCEEDLGRLRGVMMSARANVPMLEFFKEVLHVQPEERNHFIKGFIDELIDAANSQERAVYEEIEYNETILRTEGDIDQAKAIFGSKKVHDEKEMNLIFEMIEWVYGADKEDLNNQSRRNMFVLTADLQKEAVEQRTKAYRAINRNRCKVKIDEYSTKADLKKPQEETAKIRQFYENKLDMLLSEIKAWPAFVGFGVAAAAAVASFFVSYGLLAITAIGAGFGVIKLLSNSSRRKQAKLQCDEQCRLTEKAMLDLCEQWNQYEAEFASYDAYVDEIMRTLENG